MAKRVKSKPKTKRTGPNLDRKKVNVENKRVPCFYNCGNFVTNHNLICRACRRNNIRRTIKSDNRKAPDKISEKKRKRNG